jgi:hypothetical protein
MGSGESVGVRGAFAIAGSLIGILLAATPAFAAEPAGDPPAAMYDPGTVNVIRLTLPPASKQKLEADPDGEYVEGTFSMATTGGTPETVGSFSDPAMVGIRLKGKYGSFRDLAHKAGFKIKFNFENEAGVKGKKFLGLKKMTLNNMVQDTSMIHERLAYEAFRATGVPSPRTGYAYLEVNGEDFGLHLNIETTDDVALEKRIGAFQHLYEGAYGSDVAPGGAGSFEIDEGDEEDVGDLNALIAAVNGTSPADFSDRVAPYADLVEMTRMWAVERYLAHWDGYTTKNNYYLVSDPSGRFQMLPWGTDQTWVGDLGFDGGGGLLFSKCLEDPSCAALYRKSLRQAQIAIDATRFDALASATGTLLAPWGEKEFDNDRREHNPTEIAAAVESTRSFIASRPAGVAAWLADKPETFATQVAVAAQPGAIVADGTATTVVTATVTDAGGAPVPGDLLEFSSSDPGVEIGAVSDHGDGTYAVPVTASTTAGAVSITATDIWPSPDVSGVTTLTQVPGPAAMVSVALAPSAIVADGASTSTATATITDLNGNPVAGDQVSFSSTDAGQRIGPVTGHGDGTYSAQITASKNAGTATISAADASVAPALAGTATLAQLPAPSATPATLAEPPPSAALPPSAAIASHPAKRTRDRTPTFRFLSADPAAAFRCKLDDRPYRSCDSPTTLSRLASGDHVFRVKAVGAGGQVGPVASYEFFVKPRRHAKR